LTFIQRILKVAAWVLVEKISSWLVLRGRSSLIWDAYEQAAANCGDYEPIVVMKKNGKKPLVVVDAEYYIQLHGDKNGTD
jgi:hypothetical protein